jgi:hypothetical protein
MKHTKDSDKNTFVVLQRKQTVLQYDFVEKSFDHSSKTNSKNEAVRVRIIVNDCDKYKIMLARYSITNVIINATPL